MQKATSEFFDMGKREGKRQGIKIGEQRGTLETQRRTVMNMHARKMPLDMIASVTELEPAEIERILKEASQP